MTKAVKRLVVSGVQAHRFLVSFEGVVGHVQSLEGFGHAVASFHGLRIEFHDLPIEADRLIELALLHMNVGQEEVGVQVVGVELDSLLQFVGRLLRTLGIEVGPTQVQVVLGVVGLQFHGFAIGFDGLFRLVKLFSHQSEVVGREGVLGVEASGLSIVSRGGFVVFLTVIGLG